MSEWVWVAVGYGVAYGSLAGYLLVLRHRWSAVRGRSEEPR